MSNEKDALVGWFLLLAREMLLNPKGKNGETVLGSESGKWESFEKRIVDISKEYDLPYFGYDVVVWDGTRQYYSSPGFYLWLTANGQILRRIPELKKVHEAWVALEDSAHRRSVLNPSRFQSLDNYERKLKAVGLEGYRQIRACFE